MKRIAAAFLFFFGCMLVVSSLDKSKKAKRYEASGVRAEARILRKELIAASRTGPAQSIFRIWFRAADSDPLTSADVDPEEFEGLREGGTFRVIHVPGVARSAVPASEFRVDNGTGEGVSGIIVLIGAIVVFWFPSAKKEEAVKIPDAASIVRKIWSFVKTAAFWLMVIVLSALIAELPFIVATQRHIDANFNPYLGGAMTLMLGGLGLMIGSLVLGMKDSGSVSDEFSFVQLKAAFRSGAISDSRWRRRLRVAIGAFTTSLGVAAILFVVGPPYLKVLTVATVIYVLVRTASGYYRS